MTDRHVRTGRTREAEGLVIEHHYSGRAPSNIQQVVTWHEDGGLFGGDGPVIAACFFTIPPTRWKEDVWELSRLVRTPACDIPLSGLISEACKMARPKIDLVVSFADQQQGHHGGIYQASSWNYSGRNDRSCDGVIIGGRFIPGRSCNSTYGTRSPEKLSKMLGIPVEPHYDEGKHLYWRALRPSGEKKAIRLGLMAEAYPKPTVKKELVLCAKGA